MAEGTRTELRRAIHPADDAAGGELGGDVFEQISVDELIDDLAILASGARELPRIRTRTPERVIGNLAIRMTEIDSVRIERRAERATGIARRRRHEDALEAGLGEDARVRYAVQRDATGQTEIADAGLALQRARRLDQRVLEHALHAGGAVCESPPLAGLHVDRIEGAARRAEEVDELRRVRSRRGRVVLEILRREREAAIRRTPNELAHLFRYAVNVE